MPLQVVQGQLQGGCQGPALLSFRAPDGTAAQRIQVCQHHVLPFTQLKELEGGRELNVEYVQDAVGLLVAEPQAHLAGHPVDLLLHLPP